MTDEITTTEGVGESPLPLPNGEISFVLTLNPQTMEFGLKPIEEVRQNLVIGETAITPYDFLDLSVGSEGEYVALSDEVWSYYAGQVGEIIKAGKKSVLGDTPPKVEKELTELELMVTSFLKTVEV